MLVDTASCEHNVRMVVALIATAISVRCMDGSIYDNAILFYEVLA